MSELHDIVMGIKSYVPDIWVDRNAYEEHVQAIVTEIIEAVKAQLLFGSMITPASKREAFRLLDKLK